MGGAFCITLRPQPCDLALSRQPLISIGFACEAFDVSNFTPGTMGLNLPIVIGERLQEKMTRGDFFILPICAQAGRFLGIVAERNRAAAFSATIQRMRLARVLVTR